MVSYLCCIFLITVLFYYRSSQISTAITQSRGINTNNNTEKNTRKKKNVRKKKFSTNKGQPHSKYIFFPDEIHRTEFNFLPPIFVLALLFHYPPLSPQSKSDRKNRNGGRSWPYLPVDEIERMSDMGWREIEEIFLPLARSVQLHF